MSRNYGVKRHPYQPVGWRMRLSDALAVFDGWPMRLMIAALAIAAVLLAASCAHAEGCVSDNSGHTFCGGAPERSAAHSRRHSRVTRHHQAERPVLDANGNGTTRVCASGHRMCVTVAASAQSTLQCVIDHVEASGVRITALGGIRRGHCSTSSMHPCGKAIDINQTARDVNGPPRSVSSAAASACGAVSGSWWARNPDNGHFQVGGWAGTHEGTVTASAHRRHHRHHRVASR